MKTVIFSAILLIVIILAVIFSAYYTARVTASLDEALSQLSVALAEEDWDGCERLFDEFSQQWDKTEPYLAILFDHNELEDTDVAIDYLGSYIFLREKPDAVAQLSALRLSVTHLKKSSVIGLGNLL